MYIVSSDYCGNINIQSAPIALHNVFEPLRHGTS